MLATLTAPLVKQVETSVSIKVLVTFDSVLMKKMSWFWVLFWFTGTSRSQFRTGWLLYLCVLTTCMLEDGNLWVTLPCTFNIMWLFPLLELCHDQGTKGSQAWREVRAYLCFQIFGESGADEVTGYILKTSK